MRNMKKVWIGCIAFLLLVIGYSGWQLAADAKEIYEGTLRLHILAESDSKADQALKLQVRDAILPKLAEWTAEAADKEESQEILAGKLEQIRQIAEATLRDLGSEASVCVTLGKQYYPTRQSEGFRLPAGEYTALQVKIGRAEGQNWWCLLFPNLGRSVSAAEGAAVETGFSKYQIRLLTEEEDPQYTIRFRIVEGIGKLSRSIKELFQ